jgi:hypothetical protein
MLKYNKKYLLTEVHSMRDMNVKGTSVITDATGSLSRLNKKYLEDIADMHSITEWQKTTIPATEQFLRHFSVQCNFKYIVTYCLKAGI